MYNLFKSRNRIFAMYSWSLKSLFLIDFVYSTFDLFRGGHRGWDKIIKMTFNVAMWIWMTSQGWFQLNFEEFFRTTDLRHNIFRKVSASTDKYYLITRSYFFFKEYTKLWPSGSYFRKILKSFGLRVGKKNEIWYFCDIWYSTSNNIIQSQIFFICRQLKF